MANNVGTYLQNARLNFIKGTTHPAAQATLYLALYTTQPSNADSGGVEVTGGSYARASIASSVWSAISGASPASITNSSAIAFTAASGSWGTIVAIGIKDASTSGNLLYVAPLATAISIVSGQQYVQAANSITISED
jgi:hypothetical protein